jgi:hypothetical protein
MNLGKRQEHQILPRMLKYGPHHLLPWFSNGRWREPFSWLIVKHRSNLLHAVLLGHLSIHTGTYLSFMFGRRSQAVSPTVSTPSQAGPIAHRTPMLTS